MRAVSMLFALCAFAHALPASAGVLEDIHARGIVTCAVPAKSPGLAETADGKRTGLAVDLCSMIAAAVLGRAGATAFVEVAPEDAALTLQAEDADILFMPRAWRFSQEVEEGVILVQPMLYRARDGGVFGPSVRQGDDAWFVAVRWLLAAMAKGTGKVPDAAGDAAVSGLGFAPAWRDEISMISKSYDALLARHVKSLEGDGWAVVPEAAGQQF